MTVKPFCLPALFVVLLTACGKTPAPETAPAATAPPTTATPTTAEPEEVTQAIPDSADGIWQAIDQKRTELKASIDSGSLANVHHQAFAIRDLVAALPGKSPSLSDDEKSKLDSDVKFVATLADRLDGAGDAGDRAGAQSSYDKLALVLDGIARHK
jgi:hypothetical protein